jgi:hypothetical protein
MTNDIWKNVVISVDSKNYKIKNTYEELLKLFNVSYILSTKGYQLRIDNLGVLRINSFELKSETNTLVIRCKRN